jgi:hypothetical protein
MTEPMQGMRDRAINQYLAYQQYRGGQAGQQAGLEETRAKTEQARAAAQAMQAEARGKYPETPEQVQRAEQMARIRAKTEQQPFIEQIKSKPEHDIGAVARALAAAKVPEGSDEWARHMQEALLLRGGATTQSVREANQPSGLEFQAPFGFGFRTKQTPQEAENTRLMNVLEQVLARSTAPFAGGAQ